MKNKYLVYLGVVLLGGMFLNSDTVADPIRGKKIQSKPTSKGYTRNNTDDEYAPRTLWDEKTFYFFGGVDVGLANYSISTLATDSSRSGLDLGVRGLAAFYARKWVVDGGAGFSFISSSGTNTAGTALKVITRTVYLDLSPRYRLSQNWQIGPELQYWFGTDNGLNSNIFSSDTNSAIMSGVKLMYEWMSDQTKYRFGARWNTNINIPDRTLNVFQVYFQIGFSPGGSKTEEYHRPYEEMKTSDLEQVEAEPRVVQTPTPEPVTEPEPEPVVMSTPEPVATPEPTPEPVAVAGPREKMVMTLDLNELPFQSDSARLPKYNRDRVKEIGRFLGEQKDSWKRLIISGHTDEQGKKPYNMKLSKARADTVRQLLGEGGAPINKIKAVGYGPNKPIDRKHTKQAWAKNRRVEMEFIGVKDGLQIQKAFKH